MKNYKCRISAAVLLVTIFFFCSIAPGVFADDAPSINKAKLALFERLSNLNDDLAETIELNDQELDAVLQSFSGLRYSFEELFFEIVQISKKLNKTIVVGPLSSVFNKYKGNNLRIYPKFDSIEFNGPEDAILTRFTPNREEDQVYFENIGGTDIYYRSELLIGVDVVNDKKVKVKTGVFSSDKIFVKEGISFKYREGDEKVDSKSILGLLSKTEIIVALKGDLEDKKAEKGCLAEIIAKKYGMVDQAGDYIK